ALAAGTMVNALWFAGGAWRSSSLSFPRLDLHDWLVLAFLGVVLTAFGYSAWYMVIREAPISIAAVTIYLQPLVGTAVAVGLTGEHLHWGHLWGGVAILAGIVVGIGKAAAPTA